MPSYIHIAGNRNDLNKKDLPILLAYCFDWFSSWRINGLIWHLLNASVFLYQRKFSNNVSKLAACLRAGLSISYIHKKYFIIIHKKKAGKLLEVICSSYRNFSWRFNQLIGVRIYGE